jgi:RNA polymerase sigma factor for flagellar operon FliA
VQKAMEELQVKFAQSYTLTDLSVHLNMSLYDTSKILQDRQNKHVLSYDALNPIDDTPFHETIKSLETPLDNIISQERQALVDAAIGSLEERERFIVILYYKEHYTLKKIALLLELSESRVSQILHISLENIRSVIKQYE